MKRSESLLLNDDQYNPRERERKRKRREGGREKKRRVREERE